MGWLRKIGRKIGKGIKKLGKAIGKGFKKVFKAFGDLGPIGHLGLAIIFPAFTGFWGTLGKGISAISKLSPAVGKVFQTVYNIGSKVKGVYNSVTGALTNTLKKIPGVGQAMEGLDKFIDRARQMIGIDAGNVPLADKEDVAEYWNSLSDKELEQLQLSRTDLFVDGKLTKFGEDAGRGKLFVEQMSERGFGTVEEIEKGYNFSSDAFPSLQNKVRMEDYAAFSENNLNNLPSSYKYNFEQKIDSMGRKGEWEWVKKPVMTPEGPTGVKVQDFKPVSEIIDTSTVSDKPSLNKATKEILDGTSKTPTSFGDKLKESAIDTGVQTVEDLITGRNYRDYQDYLRRGTIGQTPEMVAASANYVQDLRPQFQQAGFQATNSNDFMNQFINGTSFGPETYNSIMAQQPIGTNVYA
tara:strand:+ start:2311 stop:3540 length:1230 start_codon:yes stop_codon:yes gene_type:complete